MDSLFCVRVGEVAVSGVSLDAQVYPEAPGEVWKLGGLPGHKDFVIALVIVKNRHEPTVVVTLDSHGYPEAVPGRRTQWPIAEHNGWRRIA